MSLTDSATMTQNREALWDKIKDIRIAMMVTDEGDEVLRSRPMYTQQPEFDGDIWFFTRDDSAKTDEVAKDKQGQLKLREREKQSLRGPCPARRRSCVTEPRRRSCGAPPSRRGSPTA